MKSVSRCWFFWWGVGTPDCARSPSLTTAHVILVIKTLATGSFSLLRFVAHLSLLCGALAGDAASTFSLPCSLTGERTHLSEKRLDSLGYFQVEASWRVERGGKRRRNACFSLLEKLVLLWYFGTVSSSLLLNKKKVLPQTANTGLLFLCGQTETILKPH